MNQFKIYFSHGKDSGPIGSKIKYLSSIAKDMNFITESLDYRSTKDPDHRVNILLNSYDRSEKNSILYGSSMGAYVSLAASKTINPAGLFLCAPALYLKDYKIEEFTNLKIPITIVHGYNDTVVPYKNSVKFAEKNLCDLHIINDDHSLSKSEPFISFVFREFLRKISVNQF